MRRLFEKGRTKEEIINIFKFLDSVIPLPNNFELKYKETVTQLKKFSETNY